MKKKSVPCAIDKQGNPVLKELLNPFFEVISPAFSAKAEEIVLKRRISYGEPGVSANYRKAATMVPLKTADFHSAVVFIRIRILSGMDIESRQTQRGSLDVRWETNVLSVQVELDSAVEHEVLTLRPNWEELNQTNNRCNTQ